MLKCEANAVTKAAQFWYNARFEFLMNNRNGFSSRTALNSGGIMGKKKKKSLITKCCVDDPMKFRFWNFDGVDLSWIKKSLINLNFDLGAVGIITNHVTTIAHSFNICIELCMETIRLFVSCLSSPKWRLHSNRFLCLSFSKLFIFFFMEFNVLPSTRLVHSYVNSMSCV